MRVGLALILALAACATGRGRGPGPAVSAAPVPDGGVRVRFRRQGGSDPDRRPELRAEGGRLDEVVFSPDLRTVSARWREPEGELRCRFPYDGAAVFGAGGPVDAEAVEYVFLEAGDARVTSALPRGCLLLPALDLDIDLAPRLLPARLKLPDGTEVELGEWTRVAFALPRDAHGVLHGGDLELTLATATGDLPFLVTVDADGTPAATSGFVRGEEGEGANLGGAPGPP